MLAICGIATCDASGPGHKLMQWDSGSELCLKQ